MSKILDLVEVHIFLFSNIGFRFLAAAIASCFRFLISSSVLSVVLSSLHFFQSWFPVLDMVYLSVLSWFMMSPLVANFGGYDSKVSCMSDSLVEILLMSSAYCWSRDISFMCCVGGGEGWISFSSSFYCSVFAK